MSDEPQYPSPPAPLSAVSRLDEQAVRAEMQRLEDVVMALQLERSELQARLRDLESRRLMADEQAQALRAYLATERKYREAPF